MDTTPISKPVSNLRDHFYDLPGGWTKRITERKSGASVGLRDVYLYAPTKYNREKIRSVVELTRFLVKHRDCNIDPRLINLEKTPERVKGPIDATKNRTRKLVDFYKTLKKKDLTIGQKILSRKLFEENADGSTKCKNTKKSKSIAVSKLATLKANPPQLTLDQPVLTSIKVNQKFMFTFHSLLYEGSNS
jgi:hypothetical protein